MPDHAYFSSQEIAREPYYQEFLVPHGFGWNAAAALGDGLLISLKRSAKRGPYDAAELALLNTALPWLRAVSRVASITWRNNLSGQLRLLERIDRGALLIDDHARVLDMNARVEFGDGLDISAGTLHAPRPADRLRLQQYLAAAVNPDSPPSRHSRTLTLPRPSGLRPWLLDAIACADALRSLHSRAAALVLITDIERPARLNQILLREMFGLTSTESKLACRIAAGQSVQEAAASLQISVGHARSASRPFSARPAPPDRWNWWPCSPGWPCRSKVAARRLGGRRSGAQLTALRGTPIWECARPWAGSIVTPAGASAVPLSFGDLIENELPAPRRAHGGRHHRRHGSGRGQFLSNAAAVSGNGDGIWIQGRQVGSAAAGGLQHHTVRVFTVHADSEHELSKDPASNRGADDDAGRVCEWMQGPGSRRPLDRRRLSRQERLRPVSGRAGGRPTTSAIWSLMPRIP